MGVVAAEVRDPLPGEDEGATVSETCATGPHFLEFDAARDAQERGGWGAAEAVVVGWAEAAAAAVGAGGAGEGARAGDGVGLGEGSTGARMGAATTSDSEARPLSCAVCIGCSATETGAWLSSGIGSAALGTSSTGAIAGWTSSTTTVAGGGGVASRRSS